MADLYCKHDTRISHFRCAYCDEEQAAAREAEGPVERDTTHPYGNPCSFVDGQLKDVQKQLAARDAAIAQKDAEIERLEAEDICPYCKRPSWKLEYAGERWVMDGECNGHCVCPCCNHIRHEAGACRAHYRALPYDARCRCGQRANECGESWDTGDGWLRCVESPGHKMPHRASEKITKELYGSDAYKARAARLAAALREIADKTGESSIYAIAAAALAQIEKGEK